MLGSASDAEARLRVIVHEPYSFSQLFHIFPFIEKARLAVLNDLGCCPPSASYDGLSRKHRFHSHSAKGLPPGTHKHDIGVTYERHRIFGIAVKFYPLRDTEGHCLLHQFRPVAFSIVPHQQQMNIDVLAGQLRERRDCLVLAFPPMQGADNNALEEYSILDHAG